MVANSSRVEVFIQRMFCGSYATLLALSIPFAARLRPGTPEFGELSSGHVGSAMVPFVAATVGFVFLMAWPGRGERLLRVTLFRGPPVLRRALVLLLLCGSFAVAHNVDDSFASVLLLVVLPGFAILLWSRGSRDPRPLLLVLPWLWVVTAALGVELIAGGSGAASVRWGDERSFATLFPREAPFVGEGGRLLPNLNVHMKSAELPQGALLVTNAQGFRNREGTPTEPSPDEFRVLSLGDSFSIGMQIEQDEFLGPLLQAELRRARPDVLVSVLNCEVSDPAYGLRYLQQHGVHYRPRIVLLGLCGNDMLQADEFFGSDRLFVLDARGQLVPNQDPMSTDDTITRYQALSYSGGRVRGVEVRQQRGQLAKLQRKAARTSEKLLGKLLRFRMFSVLQPARPRSTVPTLMHSYATSWERSDGKMRLLDGTANLGYFYTQPEPRIEALYAKLFELLGAFEQTTREAGARLVVVLHPQRFQVSKADWGALRDRWGLLESDFDLEQYNRRVSAFCSELGITCCDLLPAFQDVASGTDLYLPRGDMHFSSAGHSTAARAIAGALLEHLEGAVGTEPR